MTARDPAAVVREGPSRLYPANPGTLPCAVHGDTPEMWVCGSCLAVLEQQLEQAQKERDEAMEIRDQAWRDRVAAEAARGVAEGDLVLDRNLRVRAEAAAQQAREALEQIASGKYGVTVLDIARVALDAAGAQE